MSKLRILRAAEIVAALQKAGFAPIRHRGSHLRLRHSDGRVVTVPCHSSTDVGRGLTRKILRDAELTEDEFLDFM